MNQNRNNQERDDGYQNTARGPRGFQNRSNGSVQVHPNLNPNYQNPIDLVRNHNRSRQQQEPEENIYERLDNDDDDDDEHNVEIARNEPSVQNNQNNVDDHTYERIDDRPPCNARAHSRAYKYHMLNHVHNIDARNLGQYDQPRHIYLDSSRLNSQFCQSRLGRLGRNCFSTENIAYASTRRSIHPFGFGCMCPFCRHLDTRYLCHHCHNLHNRLRYQDGNNAGPLGNSRHYVYQVSRSCRCPFCRGDYTYAKFPVNPNRPAESLRVECHCRNAIGCTCRNKVLPNSNSAMQIGRYLDWINRTGPSVNNPLYATIHIGRIDRSCVSGSSNVGGNPSTIASPGVSTSNSASSSAASNEPGASANLRSIFVSQHSSTSNASVCPMSRTVERQHTCDDSCIRNQSVAGICQFLGRCEKAECNHGRLSVHWWFVNKWLPSWNSHNPDRNMDVVPTMEEEPREQQESDSDEA